MTGIIKHALRLRRLIYLHQAMEKWEGRCVEMTLPKRRKAERNAAVFERDFYAHMARDPGRIRWPSYALAALMMPDFWVLVLIGWIVAWWMP